MSKPPFKDIIQDSGTIPSEIKELLEVFGRSSREGEVKDTHLSKVLFYLQKTRTENLKSTIAKLTLILGINRRFVRENYLDGLIEFNVIDVHMIKNSEVWFWKGLKAFQNNGDSK